MNRQPTPKTFRSRPAVALAGLKIVGVMLACVAINTLGMVVFSLGVAYAGAFQEAASPAYIALVALASLAGVLVAAGLLALFNRFVLKLGNFGRLLPRATPARLLAWVAIALSMVAALIAALALSAPVSLEWRPQNLATGAAMMTAVAFFPGVVEEMAYRWIVYDYARRHLPRFTAACASGLLFGVIHLDQTGGALNALFLMAAALSVTFLFAALYDWAGSLMAAIVMHWVWDMFFLHIGVAVTTDSAMTGAAEDLFGSLDFTQFLRLHFTFGNPVLAGGAFGVEASPFGLLLFAGAAAFFWRRGGGVSR